MAYNSLDPVDGHPIFLDSDAPDVKLDPQQAAEYAADVGNRIVRDTAGRLSYSYPRAGLRCFDTDFGAEFLHDGVSWKLQRSYGWLRRDDSQSVNNDAVTVASFPAGATSVLAGGMEFDAANSALVVPVAGVYTFGYSHNWTNNTTGRREFGPYVNGSSVNGVRDRTADPGSPSGAYSPNAAWDILLAAGDVVQTFLLQASGAALNSSARRMWLELKAAT